MALFTVLRIDNFHKIRDVAPSVIDEDVLATVRDLDEKGEIEPWIQAILHDTNHTPHGPSEIVDILTHKMRVNGKEGTCAFILKGKAFPVVRPKHVSHQIFRLERIRDLSFTVFGASGDILDEVKEQFVATSVRLDCEYGFLDAHDLGRLFIAFGYLCPRDGQRIRGGKCRCGYSPQTHTSNLLQQEALVELHGSHVRGNTAGAVILPTGAGKTHVAVTDIRRQNPHLCIYVAHSHEILQDAEVEFLRQFPREAIWRFQCRPTPSQVRQVNLITIQALSRNLDVFKKQGVDYLVIDEFHHAAARGYRSVIDALSPKFLLGLTATPFRGDRQDVLDLCKGNVIVCYELREGIELGILCPYHYFGCFDNVDYANIRHNGIRYDVRDLERALTIPERDMAMIRKWREKAEGKPTLAFCCSHRHAERVAASFRRDHIAAAPYLSTTPSDQRSRIRDKFAADKIKVLCVVDVLNEGVDLPFAECLLFLRPTESKRIFFQQLGRGLRHFVGKKACIVIDFIGNFQNAYRVVEYHGLDPYDGERTVPGPTFNRTPKELLNLPNGCTVEFDERVIDLFGNQTLNPAYATRHNIGRILLYQYQRLARRLGRRPTKIDVDRQCLLDTTFYASVFGSWTDFENKFAQPE
jgi:superfamily II DNA or RNA helicase